MAIVGRSAAAAAGWRSLFTSLKCLPKAAEAEVPGVEAKELQCASLKYEFRRGDRLLLVVVVGCGVPLPPTAAMAPKRWGKKKGQKVWRAKPAESSYEGGDKLPGMPELTPAQV